MSVSKEQLETLKRKVINAFTNVSCPKGNVTTCKWDECRDLNKDFSGKNWKRIEPELIRKNHDKLSFFLPEAFHYFFPAYLIYSLENFHYEYFYYPYDDTCEYTIYAVIPQQNHSENDLIYFRERFKLFTSEQIDCINEFLVLVEEDESFDVFSEEVKLGKERLKEFTKN